MSEPMQQLPKTTKEMFPPPLSQLIEAAATRSEAHPAAIGIHILVAFGNAVGRGPHTYVGETRHGCNVWSALVGDTGDGRKGDSKHVAFAPFLAADPDWSRYRVAGGLSSGEGMIHHVRDAREAEAQEKGEKGGKAQDLGVADKRALFVEPEFTSVLKNFRRDGNNLSEKLRDAWDGREVLQTVTKHAPTIATGAHISVMGHTTRDDLRRHLDDMEIANGLANRFLVVACRRPRLIPSPQRLPNDVRAAVATHLREALAAARDVGELHRTNAAERLWCNKLYEPLSQPRPGLLGALLARGPAHVTRLSLVFALLARTQAVDLPHLTAACAWWDYVEASTRIVFGGRTGNQDADRIQAELLPGQSMTLSDIRVQIFKDRITAARLRDALDLLRRMGVVTIGEDDDTGGRPATIVTRRKAEEAAA